MRALLLYQSIRLEYLKETHFPEVVKTRGPGLTAMSSTSHTSRSPTNLARYTYEVVAIAAAAAAAARASVSIIGSLLPAHPLDRSGGCLEKKQLVMAALFARKPGRGQEGMQNQNAGAKVSTRERPWAGVTCDCRGAGVAKRNTFIDQAGGSRSKLKPKRCRQEDHCILHAVGKR